MACHARVRASKGSTPRHQSKDAFIFHESRLTLWLSSIRTHARILDLDSYGTTLCLSCLPSTQKIRAVVVKLDSHMLIITAANLTGSLSEQDIHCLATALYNNTAGLKDEYTALRRKMKNYYCKIVRVYCVLAMIAPGLSMGYDT